MKGVINQPFFCSYSEGLCRVNKSCLKAKEMNIDLNLNLSIYDQVKDPVKKWLITKRYLPLLIDKDSMYISGSKMNDSLGDNSCYLPVIKHSLDRKKFIFGNIMMS